MAKPIALKTARQERGVTAYLKTLSESERAEAEALLTIFTQATKGTPTLWGSNIIGFGQYEYERANGDYGTFLATGFSIRKAGPTIYIMPGYHDYSETLKGLGRHKLGKSCLYLKRVADIDQKVLVKLITQGLKDLKAKYPVKMI